MSVLVGTRPSASAVTKTSAPPLRVGIAEECDVIVHGVWSMLFPFAHRVALIAPDPRFERRGSDRGAHLVLHETQRSGDLTEAAGAAFDRDLMSGRAVIYSWDVARAVASWTDHRRPAGFVSKTLSAADLVAALERIHACDPVAGDVSLTGLTDRVVSTVDAWPGRSEGLGRKQSVVLGLIASGITNQEIAETLFISINTVKSYVRATYQKIGAETRSQAMLWALDHGFRESTNGPNRLRSVSRTDAGR